MATYDTIIVGGGAVGTSALFHLAERGEGRTLLLEKLGGYGRGATGVWGSLVRMFFANLQTTQATTRSVPFYADFARRVGEPFPWNRTGSLYFLDRASLPEFQEHLAALAASGLEHALIEPLEGRRRFPDFAWFEDDVAVYEPQAGVCSPRGTTEAFLRAAARTGAEARHGAEVVEVLSRGAHAVGVRMRDGETFHCKKLVVCAGIWTNQVLESARARVEAFPVKIQLNRFCRHHRPLTHPFFIDLPALTFGHPTGTGSFIGGYQGNDAPSRDLAWSPMSPEEANKAKHRLARRIPWVKSATLEGGIQALENYTEGNFGFVELLAGYENVVVSTGWSCAGFTLAPVAGERIAELVQSL